MARWLARPYPVAHLTRARAAIAAAAEGELDPLMALYRAARAALREADPDEVREHDEAWAKASSSDKVARQAARRIADAWEGIVSVGARIDELDGDLDAPSRPVAGLLGLGEADVDGVDPLDGLAITPADLPTDPPQAWGDVLERARGTGLLLRRAP